MNRRDVQRIIFNLIFGPLIGGAMFFVAVAVFEVAVLKAPPAVLADFKPSSLPLLIVFTYFVSAPPALLNGVVTSIVSHLTQNRTLRIAAALISGAIWSGLLIGAVVVSGDTAIAPTSVIAPIATVLGALDSLVVYLLFERLFRAPANGADGT